MESTALLPLCLLLIAELMAQLAVMSGLRLLSLPGGLWGGCAAHWSLFPLGVGLKRLQPLLGGTVEHP